MRTIQRLPIGGLCLCLTPGLTLLIELAACLIDHSVLRSAMAIIQGGGVDAGRTVGMESYLHLVGDFVRDYLALCEWLGVSRAERLHPSVKKYLEY